MIWEGFEIQTALVEEKGRGGGESGGFRNGDSGILRPIQRVIISHSFLFRGFIESPELPLVRPRHTVLLIVLQY